MRESELHFASATAIAAAIRAGELSSREAAEAHLRRIDEVNVRLNAVVRLADDALDQARQADANLRAGRAGGSLHGVPITIKDSLDTAGLVTTAGTTGWRERVPEHDATVVARLRAAGAIIIGKSNTPEFTWSNETDNDLFGRTNNPYDLERSTGGSSGGAAAIVAAGGSPLDIGSDTADSIRLPSHYCGVVGIKPTQGRVPLTGHNPSYRGIIGSWTQLGPIARSVDDVALALTIIAGPDDEDPHAVPMVLRDHRAIDLAGLRVVFFTDNGVRTPAAEVIAAVRSAARALVDAGASVEERVPPHIAELAAAWWEIAQADGHAWLLRLLHSAGTPGIGSYPWLADQRPVPAAELTAMLERVDDARAGLTRFMRDVDLIVSPAGPLPAFRHGEGDGDAYADSYCEAHNLTGWPSVVVRGGSFAGGLPLGVQLVAKPWRDDVALAAAKAVEVALGGWQPPPL